MKSFYRIYKRSMAEFLIDHDCPLEKIVPDIVHPNLKNWLFEDTPKLRETMSLYSSRKRAN